MLEDDASPTLLPPSVALSGEFVLPDACEAGPARASTAERLAFRVGALDLLCAADLGREVVPPPAVSRLPHLPAWLLGVANVRGMLLPVVDLAVALAVERDTALRPYLLIVGAGDAALGLLVDGLPAPRTFEAAERLDSVPPHPPFLGGYVTGGYQRDGALWLDVDIGGFLEGLGRRLTAAAAGSRPVPESVTAPSLAHGPRLAPIGEANAPSAMCRMHKCREGQGLAESGLWAL
jgi:chemotaxis signal transduction protein